MQKVSKLLRGLLVTVASSLLVACATSANWPSLGISATPGYTWSDFLKDTDSNSSETVEADEFTDYINRQGGSSEDITDSFDDIDLDANGSINESEFDVRPATRPDAQASKVLSWRAFVAQADRNDDGTVNETEWVAVSRKRPSTPKRNEFRKYDIDGDGQVTVAEYQVARKQ